jgi:predicted permease
MRAYRWLLRLFPGEFRARFGDAMAETFADRLRGARAHGGRAVMSLWLRTVVDVFLHGLAERRAARQRTNTRRIPMDTALLDIAYALRLLRRRPGFTATAVTTLALGIGINVAIFSAVRAVLIDDLPYPNPDELVHVSLRTTRATGGITPSVPVFELLRSGSSMLQSMAAAVQGQATISGGNQRAEHVNVSEISEAMTAVTGLGPIAGRTLTPDDYREPTDAVLISRRLWHARYGGSADALGRGIRVNGIARTIVGVMPDAFDLSPRSDRPADLWLPLIWRNGEGAIGSGIIARLPQGSDLSTATRDIDRLMPALPVMSSGSAYTGIKLTPFVDRQRGSARQGLLLLQGAAGLLLLIACANLGNLLLTHASSRRREVGVRSAIGASRGRLVRQVMTETAVLGLAGGGLGVLLAYWTVPVLVSSASWTLPRTADVAVRLPEFGIGMTLAIVTALGVAAAPAWIATRIDVVESLRHASHLGASRVSRLLPSGLVIVEVLLAVVVLASAGLLLNSFARVVSLPMGFDTRGIVVAEVPAREGYTSHAALLELAQRLRQDLANRLGGVEIAFANSMPYTSAYMGPANPISPDGRYERFTAVPYRVVSADYFDVLRIALVRGRGFASTDASGGEPVAVVNEQFVREYGPAGEILGTLMKFGPRQATIVGVVADTRNFDVTRPPEAALYWPMAQRNFYGLTLAVRGGRESEVVDAIRNSFFAIDPDLAPGRIESIDARMRHSQVQRRFYLMMLALFAGLGVALASVGIYGVTAHAVGLRTREFGVRLALGSTPRALNALVVRQGLKPVGLGLAVGLIGAWWATEWLKANATFSAFLYRISAHDPATFAAATAGLLLIGALACWIPARRAGRVDPVGVLKTE